MSKKKKTNAKGSDWSTTARNLIIFGCFLLVFYLFMRFYISPTESREPITEQFILQRTWDNYYHDVDSIAEKFDLNTAYLMSLIVLECSGRLEFEPRFEDHVYKQLKYARDHKKNFGTITHRKIRDANDEALENLATSWGPFQVMGYQVIQMGVGVQEIRGSENIYWGIYWINKRYRRYLKKKDYKNAFHIHNTGQPIPKNGIFETHDPKYVPRGLAYMKYFEKKIRNEKLKDAL
jgi:hypothetical protein